MTTFIDSNVLVYALDRGERRKQAVAQAVLEEQLRARSLVTSTQVMQETYNVLTRKKSLAPNDAMALLRLLAKQDVVPSDADFVLRGVQLSQAAQLSLWDALIVQAALDAGCDRLLSEDLQAGRRFGALEVVNPFALAAHEPPPAAFTPRRRRAKGS